MVRRTRAYPLVLALMVGVLLALTGVASALTAQPGGDSYQNLEPGQRADLDEQVPVNFVFVGYEPDDVSTERFLSGLPREYKPIVLFRYFYNESVKKSLLGLNYTYDYNVRFADADYEKRVFGYLSSIAKPAPLTEWQLLYNGNNEKFCNPPDEDPANPVPCQENGVRDVKNNHHIDAPSVERWLAENPPAGVDTDRNTVFFVNWWGDGTQPRPGFKHHVYTKTDEPDPDTRFDFGELDSRKLIAWGGTTAEDEETGLGSTKRVWFHDLSAGPDSFTDNWNVDDPDLTGDGVEDYRLPPVWEYFAPNGYRGASELTGDLAKVSRYVAIDLLFTSSPAYPPQFTPRLLPNRINLDVNTVEGWPGVNASQRYQTPGLVLDEIDELHRLPYSIDQQDIPYEGKARECYLEWTAYVYSGGAAGKVCYERYRNYPPFANLFLYGASNLDALLDNEQEERQYEAVLLNWATEDVAPDQTTCCILGIADENYRNGTQSFVFSFVSPGIAEAGYGLSTTQIHEYGHHLHLNHPFNGFDYETETVLLDDGEFYFVGVGNEVNTIMSYVDLNWDFSQFDRDNTDRFQAAAYINNANALAKRILNSPKAGLAKAELTEADGYYGEAKAALAAHDYAGAFDNARRAYEAVLSGAREAGVKVEASENGRTAVPAPRALVSRIPGEYIDRPEPRDVTKPPQKQGTQDIEVGESQDFSPLGHRLRR
jgi:hypothetical protein